VEQLVESNVIKLVLAQVDVLYSNSMIEAWWRSLKHQWLYLITLDTKETVAELVGFYVTQHNIVIPHFALDGLTPDEAYFGTGANVRAQLTAARLRAQQDRLADN
jgi:transposase InsO family protein